MNRQKRGFTNDVRRRSSQMGGSGMMNNQLGMMMGNQGGGMMGGGSGSLMGAGPGGMMGGPGISILGMSGNQGMMGGGGYNQNMNPGQNFSGGGGLMGGLSQMAMAMQGLGNSNSSILGQPSMGMGGGPRDNMGGGGMNFQPNNMQGQFGMFGESPEHKITPLLGREENRYRGVSA